jgi:two-component system LytT family response regulator
MNNTCIIIDDEKLARDLLIEYLDDFDQVNIVATCKNGMEAIQKIEEEKPDIIFLDVHMPSINGFEVLEAISYKPKIIFTTAYDKYAVKAFEKNAVDYLLKPIDKTRFKESINRVLAPTSKSPDIEKLLEEISNQSAKKYSETIFVQKSDKYFRISASDIVYLEASGDYTVISTDKEQYVSSKGISKLESKLDPDLFFRIHRSTIINQNQLSEIEKHFNGGMIAKMKNGKIFPISRSYVKVIREKIL